MTHRALRVSFLPALLFTALLPSMAMAQATRTWVSGVGDDANPCSRTAPCKTFAGAISKTADQGEISTLDPGGFGAVTITKGMTLSGDGTLAGVLASGGVNGIVINAPGDRVVLRRLSIHNATMPALGSEAQACIRILSAASVVIEDVTMMQCAVGVSIGTTGNIAIVVKDSTIQAGTAALLVAPVVGFANVSVSNSTLTGAQTGIDARAGLTSVTSSEISNHSLYGVHSQGNASVSVERSQLLATGLAVQADPGSTIRLGDNGLYNNTTLFGCTGGTISSQGNNRRGGNTNQGCAPNAVLAVQ